MLRFTVAEEERDGTQGAMFSLLALPEDGPGGALNGRAEDVTPVRAAALLDALDGAFWGADETLGRADRRLADGATDGRATDVL